MSRGTSRRSRRLAGLVVACACLAAGGCALLRSVHAEANRESDVEGYAADGSGPDAMVDRLGEPDEWKNRKEGDRLLMTAIWYCVEGEYREMTWQSRIHQKGTEYWAVVSDVSRDCERDSQ